MLRNRSILGLISAELVSLTGTSMTFVALPWFVLVTTGSTAKLGWVMAAELIPVGLFAGIAGLVFALDKSKDREPKAKAKAKA